MENKQISVVVDRRVLPEKMDIFKGYMKSIIDASSKFPGYLGGDVINPEESNRYIIIFRFASQKELDNWTNSKERQLWVDKIDQVVEKTTKMISLTGLETWFSVSKSNDFVPPPKYKMAIVTYLAIAPTITVVNLLFSNFLNFLNFIPKHLLIFVTSPFMVILMTYLVMPMMTKLFAKYLYGVKKNS